MQSPGALWCTLWTSSACCESQTTHCPASRWNFWDFSSSLFFSRFFSFQTPPLFFVQATILPSLAFWKHVIIFLITVAALLYYRVSSQIRCHMSCLLPKMVLFFFSRACSRRHLTCLNFLLIGLSTHNLERQWVDSSFVDYLSSNWVLYCNALPNFSFLVDGKCFHIWRANVGQLEEVLQHYEAPQVS